MTGNPSSVKLTAEKPVQINNKESITQSIERFGETVEVVKAQINYDVVAIDRENDISYLDYNRRPYGTDIPDRERGYPYSRDGYGGR